MHHPRPLQPLKSATCIWVMLANTNFICKCVLLFKRRRTYCLFSIYSIYLYNMLSHPFISFCSYATCSIIVSTCLHYTHQSVKVVKKPNFPLNSFSCSYNYKTINKWTYKSTFSFIHSHRKNTHWIWNYVCFEWNKKLYIRYNSSN